MNSLNIETLNLSDNQLFKMNYIKVNNFLNSLFSKKKKNNEKVVKKIETWFEVWDTENDTNFDEK